MAKSAVIAINGAAFYGEEIQRFRKSRYSEKFVHVSGMKQRMQMLKLDRAQGVVEDHFAGCHYFYQHQSGISNQLKSIVVNKVDVAFMFSKGVVTHEFIRLFNLTMSDLLAQGLYDKLVEQYPFKGC